MGESRGGGQAAGRPLPYPKEFPASSTPRAPTGALPLATSRELECPLSISSCRFPRSTSTGALVCGVATAYTPDSRGTFDYASSKPYFQQWSAEALAASRGRHRSARFRAMVRRRRREIDRHRPSTTRPRAHHGRGETVDATPNAKVQAGVYPASARAAYV